VTHQKEIPAHPSDLQPRIVQKVYQRRGSLYAFPTLDPTKTALVVVDLDMGTARDAANLQQVADNVNELATALRDHGGTVAWVITPIQKPTKNFQAVFGTAASKFENMGRPGGAAHMLWPELNPPTDTDIRTTKLGHSAFFPGKCDLNERLKAKGIESILIVGAVTNVCCEASARDAAELDYQVTLISDAMAGLPGLIQGTLTTFFRWYGDVRTSQNVIQLLSES
jgi:nicotinamidase-related amidase